MSGVEGDGPRIKDLPSAVRSVSILLAVALASPLGGADIISQTDAQGNRVLIQRDAIVVKEDSSSVYYKHFDLKERRVEKVALDKGALPYLVNTSPPEDRQQIVEVWKRFGYKATVTDQTGKSTRVFDAYLDFYPPGGRGSLLESVPPRTRLPVELDNGGADEIEFSKIARIEFYGARLKLTLRDGQTLAGKFLMPTSRPAEARFLGLTDHYNPVSEDVFDFSLPLVRIKEIRFE